VGQKLRLVNLTNQISCEAVLVWRGHQGRTGWEMGTRPGVTGTFGGFLGPGFLTPYQTKVTFGRNTASRFPPKSCRSSHFSLANDPVPNVKLA
jgi:hypothetical protein